MLLLVAALVRPTKNVPSVTMTVEQNDPLFLWTGGTAAGLTLWELAISPALKRRGLIADRPLVQGYLTEAQKEIHWLTPLTCDDKVPLPTLDDLDKADYCVGRVDDVYQFITTSTGSRERVSPEFSLYYGTDVYIYKEPVTFSERP